jgi:hypothetical protein
MTEQPPTRYPDAWHPVWAPPLDEEPEPGPQTQPLAMELHAAAMSDEEWQAFVKRARGARG